MELLRTGRRPSWEASASGRPDPSRVLQVVELLRTGHRPSRDVPASGSTDQTLLLFFLQAPGLALAFAMRTAPPVMDAAASSFSSARAASRCCRLRFLGGRSLQIVELLRTGRGPSGDASASGAARLPYWAIAELSALAAFAKGEVRERRTKAHTSSICVLKAGRTFGRQGRASESG